MSRPSRWFHRTEVERGHSSDRRLHFGKGMSRGWPRSTCRFKASGPLALLGFICLAFVSTSVDARTFVLKADGTGDVATFQAGVDSLMQHSTICAETDTLIVLPGTYEEIVQFVRRNRQCDVSPVILAPGGFEQTRLRAFVFPDFPPHAAGYIHRLSIEGLTVLDEVRQSGIQGACRWKGCCFDGGFTSLLSKGAALAVPFSDCEFRKFAILQGYGWSYFEGCRFRSATAYLDLSEYGFGFQDCSFEGPVDTAVVSRTSGDVALSFDRCTFTNAGRGIVHRQGARDYLQLADCAFRDIKERALDAIGESDVYPGSSYFSLFRASFSGCGSALRVRTSNSVELAAVTLRQCFEGIDIEASKIGVSGLAVSGCASFGARLDFKEGYSNFIQGSVTNSSFSDNGASGLELRGILASESEPPIVRNCLFQGNGSDGLNASIPIRCIQNTSALNRGGGFHLGDVNPPSSSIQSNISAGNHSAGFSVTDQDTVRYNDSFADSVAFVGQVDPDSNMTVDPQFCDPLAGDFHVAGSSPCAPTGPYGQIGAFGVGCDAMTVPLDVQSHTINLSSNASVQAAILGHRLFDPRRVDPLTVRLAGAMQSPRGKTGPHLRDVNQDGFGDLSLSFNARDLHPENGEVTLEGRTFDGAPFRGMDVVEIKSASSAALEEPTTAPSRLALSVSQAHGGIGPVLLLDLTSHEPATIEVFDVAGRRVLSTNLPAVGPGHHRLEIQERLVSGLYLLRLRQGANAVVARAVVLR